MNTGTTWRREDPEERSLWRKRRRKAFVEAVAETVGMILLAVMGFVLAWAFLAATPAQSSAINDLEAESAP